MSTVRIGVIGGTGLYSMLENGQEVKVETPYGDPSDAITIGEYKGKEVAFLPRHGKSHQLPPHKINYQANIWALKSMGVKFIISPCAAGSLQKNIKPGDFVIADQFVDRTNSRADTFYDQAPVTHMPGADPFCTHLSKIAYDSFKGLNLPVHQGGTAVVIQGPRFSTRAESKWFTQMGWDVINMTLYPEVILARELEMSYVNIALITDYDTGFNGEYEPVNAADAVRVFHENTAKLKDGVFKLIENIDITQVTESHSALQTARF
ncbi:S-methyl-5'-thioadenosine phosphorylase [Candidatus Marinamargulisbacteria bacterium SCGC AAA071-K20]|nr:S-methyl-5'-thioadenosine phosphorylase [Candidatus Marinamargulisbacteria bacterium SCGC AAA071-K20]